MEWWTSLDGTSFNKTYIAEGGLTYDVNITGRQLVYFAFASTEYGSSAIQSAQSGDIMDIYMISLNRS